MSRYLIILICLLAAEHRAGADGNQPLPQDITSEEFRELLNTEEAAQNLTIGPVLAEKTPSSGRLNLIEEYLSRFDKGTAWNLIEEMKESDFKDDILIMTLRKDLTFALDYSKPLSKNYPSILSEGSFRRIIMKYLPGLLLADCFISTPVMRGHLAEALEDAREHPGEVENIKKRLREISKLAGYPDGKMGLVAFQDPKNPTAEELAAQPPKPIGESKSEMLERLAREAAAKGLPSGSPLSRSKENHVESGRQLSSATKKKPAGSGLQPTDPSGWQLWAGLGGAALLILLLASWALRGSNKADQGI